MTPRQREVLRHRVARAVMWGRASNFDRESANAMAEVIVREIEFPGQTATTQKVVVSNIVKRLEEAS